MQTIPVSLRLPVDLVDRIDTVAKAMHNSRTGAIAFLCSTGMKALTEPIGKALEALDEIQENQE